MIPFGDIDIFFGYISIIFCSGVYFINNKKTQIFIKGGGEGKKYFSATQND